MVGRPPVLGVTELELGHLLSDAAQALLRQVLNRRHDQLVACPEVVQLRAARKARSSRDRGAGCPRIAELGKACDRRVQQCPTGSSRAVFLSS